MAIYIEEDRLRSAQWAVGVLIAFCKRIDCRWKGHGFSLSLSLCDGACCLCTNGNQSETVSVFG